MSLLSCTSLVSALILVSPEAPDTQCSLEGSLLLKSAQGEDEVPAFAEVYIANASVVGTDAPSRHTVIQIDTQFKPRALVVQGGDTVDFRNEDNQPHEVHAIRDVNLFDVKKENSKDLTYSKLFLKTGISTIGCRIHSNMGAIILTVPNSFHAHVDPSGKWKISGLPKRELEVVFWEAGGKTVTQKLTPCVSGPTHVALGGKTQRTPSKYGLTFQ